MDEGCISTCDSVRWGSLCNEKLVRFGVQFKWTNIENTPSIVGIGNKTKTLGQRAVPCDLLARDGEVVKGDIESFETDNGGTPMLLSLYSQCTLGMIKDLETGKVGMKVGHARHEIPFYRCKLTVNLTEGLIELSYKCRPDKPVSDHHRFLCRYRIANMASASGSGPSFAHRLSTAGLAAPRRGCRLSRTRFE